jgi:hypothetical protein
MASGGETCFGCATWALASENGPFGGIESGATGVFHALGRETAWRIQIPQYEQNRLLASLMDGDLETLSADLQDIELEPRTVIFEANEPITHVYLPMTGIVSLIVVGSGGRAIRLASWRETRFPDCAGGGWP